MKELLTLWNKLPTALLGLVLAAGTQAQSLGTPLTSAWIGRPLEMTVPTRFASPDSRDECVHADVFFGDTRLPAHRVRASILGADPQQKRVRIETDAVIDEPVVTVSVRAGCHNAVTRSYTLLPDVPSEQVLAALAARRPWAPAPAAPLSPAMAAAAAMAPIQLAAATSTSPTVASTGPRRARPVAVARREGAPSARTARMERATRATAPAPQAVAAARSGPRLRLEPIEADGNPLLRTSAQLATPGGDAARRATATLLWQALNADPQEVLRTTVMLQSLERDLGQLRQDAGRTRAEMAALRQRLDAVQPWQPSTGLLQLLVLLLLAAAAAASILWYRTRRDVGDPWYAQASPSFTGPPAHEEQPSEGGAATAGETGVETPDADPVSAGAPALPAVPVVPAEAAESSPVPTPVVARGPIAFDDVPASASSFERRGTGAVLRVETLAATFEEVEFLSSLGLTVDAAGVLKSYLQDSSRPAPIAFFELIRLCEQEGDTRAADLVRSRYAQVFGVAAPRLEQVTAPLGLDCMPVLSGRVTAAWNTPRVMQVIEDALFGPGASAPMLTLQAGRDLLCLHDVAMNLVADAAQTPPGGGHALAPWAHAQDAAGARMAVQSMTDVGDGSVLGVDIDLGTVAAALQKLEGKGGRQPPELAVIPPDIAPLIEEMHAAARAAEELAAHRRRQQEEEDAFSAAVASERMPIARH